MDQLSKGNRSGLETCQADLLGCTPGQFAVRGYLVLCLFTWMDLLWATVYSKVHMVQLWHTAVFNNTMLPTFLSAPVVVFLFFVFLDFLLSTLELVYYLVTWNRACSRLCCLHMTGNSKCLHWVDFVYGTLGKVVFLGRLVGYNCCITSVAFQTGPSKRSHLWLYSSFSIIHPSEWKHHLTV